MGDCWLLSSLAEVAARDPADIRNMFTADGTAVENGSTVSLYKVRFFNSAGVAEYVTVDTELPSGGGYYDHPVNGVLWVALAEKAYAEANGAGIVTTGSVGSDSYAALNDGDPAWALQAITGKSASDFAINPTNIAAAWNAGELVVLGTSSAGQFHIVSEPLLRRGQLHRVQQQAFRGLQPLGDHLFGMALGTFNGHEVYGLFNADATFLSQNFAIRHSGPGPSATGNRGIDTGTHRGVEAATDLLLAKWVCS